MLCFVLFYLFKAWRMPSAKRKEVETLYRPSLFSPCSIELVKGLLKPSKVGYEVARTSAPGP